MFNRKKDNSLVKDGLIFFWEIFKVIIISLAIIIPVRYFLIQPFYVKGASMEPNFEDHEYLIIDEITYRFNEPKRGEVVVFRYPVNPSDYFIKRIIGLPGERIKISEGKVIIFNDEYPEGWELPELYIDPDNKNTGNIDEKILEGEYYLLGDNRDESLDSRFFGAVSKKFIIGRVLLRGWPLNRFGLLLDVPKYN